MDYMNDFAQAVNYIASAIDMTTKNTSTSARQISELNRLGMNNNGHGRGRGGGRSARGRGRGRDSHGGRGWGTINDASGIDSLGSKSYSPLEWQNLSTAQHQEVYRQRKRLETARTVAAVITESVTTGNGDDASQLLHPRGLWTIRWTIKLKREQESRHH